MRYVIHCTITILWLFLGLGAEAEEWVVVNDTVDRGDTRVLEGDIGDSSIQPQYRLIAGEKYGYELIWRERKVNQWPQEVLVRLSQGEDRPPSGPWVYNWVARRDPCFLVSGDLPRFALMRTYRTPDINPSFMKMGDLRIRLLVEEQAFWLDEAGPVEARFFPWGTVHELELPGVELTCRAETTLVDNRGVAVEFSLIPTAKSASSITVEFHFGGIGAYQPQLPSSYLPVDPSDGEADQIELTANGALVSSDLSLSTPLYQTDETRKIVTCVSIEPDGDGSIAPGSHNQRFVSRHSFVSLTDEKNLRVLFFQRSKEFGEDIRIEDFDSLVEASEDYYRNLLDRYEIRTPERIVDAGFYAAIMNLEYGFAPPAWYEGLHKWNSYLVNNYQISAAVCLGQLDRARNALLFLGGTPIGPCPNIRTDGTPFLTGTHQFEEGIPYFVLQLCRYWQATGDAATVDVLWEPLVRNFEKMLEVRDPDGNALTNWHYGCNMFLYQADHLNLPGDAFSPSIMMAYNLDQLASIAQSRGEEDRARRWRQRADYVHKEVVRCLWNRSQGKFNAAIDTQGKTLEANYYTDFVYPVLYSSLPSSYGWIGLKSLDRTLWLGNHLMRTGNYMPPLFGNNQVHPVQMAESAEAYFRSGRPEEGYRLLLGVARASTVLTDSPGSFPERMSDSGFGQVDYNFVNPAGAFIRAVVGGLFGLERMQSSQSLFWQPAVPAEWDSAFLKVDDIEMKIEGNQEDRFYRLTIDKGARSLQLLIPLYDYSLKDLTDEEGNRLAHKIVPHPGGGFLEVTLPASSSHAVRLQSRKGTVELDIPHRFQSGQEVEWLLPKGNMRIEDIQDTFDEFHIDGRTLSGILAQAGGVRQFFLIDEEGRRTIPVEIDIGDPPPSPEPLFLDGKRTALDLQSYFNSDSINLHNFWAGGPSQFDFSPYLNTNRQLTVGPLSFTVEPTDKNLIQFEIGELTHYEMTLPRVSQKFRSVSVDVGRSVSGIELLTAAEFKIRLTNMQVGSIALHYSDGYLQLEPLAYGVHLDCAMKPFAAGVFTRELNWLSHVAAFAVETNPEKILEKIEIEIEAVDGNFGVFAINVIESQ